LIPSVIQQTLIVVRRITKYTRHYLVYMVLRCEVCTLFHISMQLDAFVCFSVYELRCVVLGKRGKCFEVIRICRSYFFEFATA